MKFAFGIEGQKPPASDAIPKYHHIVTPEGAVDSLVFLLREHTGGLSGIYKRLEHEVYKILSVDGSLRDEGTQPQTDTYITQVVMPIVFCAYAYARTSHFSVLSIDDYGRDIFGTADRIFTPICTALVLCDLGLTSVNPRWDPAVVATHLADTDADKDRLDRATVIRHISTASHWAAYLCIAYDNLQITGPYISDLPKEATPTLNEIKVAKFVTNVERKLVRSKAEDPRPLNFFRRIIDGEIHGPRPSLSGG